MAARGIPYKEIGKALGLSERTIKYHMGRLLELLHLENRAQVIAYAAKMGLVEDKEKQ
ncbi:MAG TPA: helix-turn-helix transcriptional regulator [Papillibacter sp.]|jgi:two-component system NarL family response regulator|nr:helix-turn-helix transcriptional regulator [Papillibacter sp.]